MKRLLGLVLAVILLLTGIHFLEACAGPASAESYKAANTSPSLLWSDTSSIMDGETIGKGDTIQNSGEETISVMFTASMFTTTKLSDCLPMRISIKDGNTVSESFLVSINPSTYTIISIHDVINLSPGTHNIHVVASGSCVITQVPVHRTTIITEP